jgi:tRNA(Leu) C34 or U34 (ribose-2'-O)-methylase TrmL
MRGYAAIGLVNPKTSANVGSAMRAAGCYGAALVVVSGNRPERYMGRIATDTQKSYRHIPTLRVPDVFDAIPYDCVPVAVDLVPDARNLVYVVHPERAFYIFGPEDGTLGEAVTGRCKFSVQVPTRFCMNLAATVNVVLYDRLAKQERRSAA